MTWASVYSIRVLLIYDRYLHVVCTFTVAMMIAYPYCYLCS